jgi:ABC-type nitrate/sulfonate/bicarbonate transport system substrate-binding protein
VRATSKAMAGAMANTHEAVKALHKLFPNANKGATEVTEEGWLKMAETVKARKMQKPIGFTYEEDWLRMLHLLKAYKALDDIKPMDDYFTNEFSDCMSKI